MISLEFWKYLKCMTLICVFLQIGGPIGAVCTQLLDSIIDYQKNSLDMVVIAKLEFKNKTYSENKNSLQNLLKEYL